MRRFLDLNELFDLIEASAQGEVDYLTGQPFPPEYDAWPERKQMAYEHGRLVACEEKYEPTAA